MNKKNLTLIAGASMLVLGVPAASPAPTAAASRCFAPAGVTRWRRFSPTCKRSSPPPQPSTPRARGTWFGTQASTDWPTCPLLEGRW